MDKEITHTVKGGFFDLAAYYQLQPERLASLVVNDFLANAPENILIISRVRPSSSRKRSKVRLQGAR